MNDDQAPKDSQETRTGNPMEIEKALAEATKLADERWDLYLRARAELDNQRKRWVRERDRSVENARVEVLNAVLPARDDLELALAASRTDGAGSRLAEGVELTLRNFDAALASLGVEELGAPGEVFDPEIHEALAAEPSADRPANTVVRVERKGYAINGRLIRPAQVTVAKSNDRHQ